jgi:predicted enzyme related to lactoylglutathione lyase
MPDRDRYIPGVPCWVDTSQPDPDGAVKFYSGLFGWEFVDVRPPDSEGKYFVARIRGEDVAAVGSLPPGSPPVAMWNTYVRVESADATAAKVLDAGGTTLMEPFDTGDAGRMAVFADPEGAVFCVWEPKQHSGAAIVNEPGTLNFNGLHTRDLARAESFYGNVFGWTTLSLPGDARMWTLPGYGDHLALDRPTLREDMAAVGAPPGFEDVVASIIPIPDDQPDTPPHWDVTFAVDDADAIAQAAAGLGGKVLVAPFDAPWVRMTVIADPQGATFTASKFVAENKDLAGAGQADAAVSAS